MPVLFMRNVMNHAPTLAHGDSLTFTNVFIFVFVSVMA